MYEPGRAARLQIAEFIVFRLRTSPRFAPKKETQERGDLRRVLAGAAVRGEAEDLITLSNQAELCAHVFREPAAGDKGAVSRRIQTFRVFLEFALGKAEAALRMNAIEQYLIPRKTRDWDEAERIGGGRVKAASRPQRLVFFDDLLAASVKAAEGKGPEHAQRDTSLISLLCFSPLRWQELVAVCWEDFLWHDGSGDSPFGGWCRCRRRDFELQLPVHRRATDALGVLYALTKRVMDRQPSGPIFRSLRHPYTQLQYGDAKQIADKALARAGLNFVVRRDLLAAYAYHLKTTHGFTNPDLREALGYSEVKHARQLLQSHEAWALNRTIDDMGGPVPGIKGDLL